MVVEKRKTRKLAAPGGAAEAPAAPAPPLRRSTRRWRTGRRRRRPGLRTTVARVIIFCGRKSAMRVHVLAEARSKRSRMRNVPRSNGSPDGACPEERRLPPLHLQPRLLRFLKLPVRPLPRSRLPHVRRRSQPNAHTRVRRTVAMTRVPVQAAVIACVLRVWIPASAPREAAVRSNRAAPSGGCPACRRSHAESDQDRPKGRRSPASGRRVGGGRERAVPSSAGGKLVRVPVVRLRSSTRSASAASSTINNAFDEQQREAVAGLSQAQA